MTSQRILAGTSDGIHAVDLDMPRMPAGHAVDHIVGAQEGIWAITDGRTVWFDPGDGQGEPVADIGDETVNCLLPLPDRTLIGGSRASLYELVAGNARRIATFDDAPGRDTWYTPWGGPPDVRSMAADVEGTLYVNVHVGGVVRSTDGGATWIDTMDIDADVHQVIADPERHGHAFAATARGLAATMTHGDTWEFSSEGLHGSYCRAVAVTADHVFVSASLGSGGRQAALYRRPRTGGRFERCTTGLPEWFSTNLDTFCLVAGDGIVAAGDADGSVYSSSDDGATWSIAATGLPEVRCLALVKLAVDM